MRVWIRGGECALLAICLCAAAARPAAVALAQAGGSIGSPRPNVLLVTIDTLRADHVGVYGYARAHTATLDRLAREGILVEDAVVQVPQTRPSHASLLTGLYPYEHGIRDNASPPLKAGTPTMATAFRAAGYDTGAFIGAYPVSRASGLQQGFATFDDPFGAGEKATTREAEMERRAEKVVDAALGWLRRPRTAPFFGWVHLFDPHAPYEPPAAYVDKTQPYDGEVAYADAQLGRLLAWLDQSGLRGRTFVVVTSDHGEGLGDHGEDEHLFFVYDSTLKVPLLWSGPGLPAGRRVAGQFRSVDLMPTVLALAGVPAPRTSGLARADVLRAGGRIPDNESYAETLYGQIHFGYAPLRALRGEGWKYIEAPRAELYRLAEDPGETKNLLDQRAQVASGMRAHLVTYDKGAGDAPPGALAAVDPAALERLAALGYVGGGGFQGGKPSGADPKDRLQEFQSYRRDVVTALRLYRENDLEGAIRLLTRLARATTSENGKVLERHSFNVDYYLGRALLQAGRTEDAIPPLASAVAQSPSAAPAWAYLADAYRGAGRMGEAAETVRRGLARVPDNPELLAIEGRILLQRGDVALARATLEKARRLAPDDPRVRVDLANLYRNAAELPAARAEAQQAIRLAPDSAEARVAWGLVLGASGREAEAGESFRAALRIAPDQADALFYLASVELRAGRPAEAVPLLERLVARARPYPGAEEQLAVARAALPAPPAPGAVHLRLIRVRERAQADAASRRAAAGEDFAEMARGLSVDASAARGGDLGFVRPEDLAEPLRSAASALDPGQVSAVLELPGGYALVQREK